MRKVIKIGFPILCVAVIGGTFILLNNTIEKINQNKLKVEEDDNTPTTTVIEEIEEDTTNTVVDPEEAKAQEIQNKAKAIEIVQKKAPPATNVYYTNEGTIDNQYLVAIRDKDTKNAKIYYIVNVENEKMEIYVK